MSPAVTGHRRHSDGSKGLSLWTSPRQAYSEGAIAIHLQVGEQQDVQTAAGLLLRLIHL